MYCSHFGLHRLPFNNTPDPTFYYSTPDHEEALATLQYATQQRKGFVLVTGEIGAGKTLIGRMFLRQMDTTARTAVITNTHLNARQLLAAICAEFNLECPPEASNLELTQRLQDYLLEQFANNRFVVVLLDEGQNLPDEAFEELRMLGNLEADDAKLLQVCILGQPELRERFRRPSLRQLDQRLFRRFHLPALSREQTGEYIRHRLRVGGGGDREVFSEEAIDRIFTASQGIPRAINQICDNCLLTGYGRDIAVIDGALVDQVVDRESAPQSAPPATAGEPVAPESRRPECPGQPGPHASDEPLSQAASSQSPSGHPESHQECEDLPEVETARIHELANEETRRLRARITSLRPGRLGSDEEMDRIASRQNELQKIVGGATTRWLAAKEKLEAYRNQIQAALNDVSAKCSRMQQQLDELSRSAAPAEDLEEIRLMHLRETQRVLTAIGNQKSELLEIQQQTEARWLETRDRIEKLAGTVVTDSMLGEVSTDLERRTESVLERLDESRRELASLLQQAQERCATTQTELTEFKAESARARSESVEALRRLNSRLAEHEEATRTLLDGVAERYVGVRETIAELEGRAAGAEELQKLRDEHSAAISDLAGNVSARLEELQRLKAAFARGASRLSKRQQAVRRQLRERVEQQTDRLEALRTAMKSAEDRVQESLCRLQESCVSRPEYEQAQESQRAELDAMQRRQETELSQLQGHLEHQRQETRTRCAQVAEYCRRTEENLESLRRSAVDIDTFEQARREQADDTQRNLLQLSEHLDRQRQEAQSRYSEVVEYCRKTEENLDTLRTATVDADTFEQVRREQADETQRILSQLNEQRRELETMITGANRQCEEAMSRIDALPSPEEVRRTQEEHSRQLEALLEDIRARQSEYDRTISQAIRRCDETKTAVEAITAQAASREEVSTIKQEHDEKLQALSESVTTLSAIDQTFSQNLSELGQQVEQVKGQQERIHTLDQKLQENEERVRALETADRPTPIQLALTPEVATQLAKLIQTAGTEKGQLTEALERAGAVAAHLHNTSAQVQEVMQHWMSTAGSVREQSQQLRASAEVASTILKAMQKCGAAIDAKLTSERWQLELTRAEQLTGRVEKATGEARMICKQLVAALADFEQCRAETERWTERRDEVTRMSETLAKLLAEARVATSNVQRTIDGRKRLMSAIAKNTSNLVEVLQSARLADEQRKPGGTGGRLSRVDQDLDGAGGWPRLRNQQETKVG